MLNLCYVGIAFSVVFYIVFGVAVRLMDLSPKDRNNARLIIIITSMISFSISALGAGLLNLRSGSFIYGVVFLICSSCALFLAIAIMFELHQINARVRMRRFMVLFDVVDRFMTEGKTQEEILEYLTGIQKLTSKEATDFLTFITDPTNHQFLVDVNEEIQAAKLLKKAEQDYYR